MTDSCEVGLKKEVFYVVFLYDTYCITCVLQPYNFHINWTEFIYEVD